MSLRKMQQDRGDFGSRRSKPLGGVIQPGSWLKAGTHWPSVGNGTGARTSGVAEIAGTKATGGRAGNIAEMLGPRLPVNVPAALRECRGQGLDPRAGTPRRGDRPKNRRAPTQELDRPPLLFNLDRFVVYFRLGSYRMSEVAGGLRGTSSGTSSCCVLLSSSASCLLLLLVSLPGISTDHSGVVLRVLCFPPLLYGCAWLPRLSCSCTFQDARRTCEGLW